MLQRPLHHLFENVLPAVADYLAAEQELSTAYTAVSNDLSACRLEVAKAKRMAANVAIAIDGLADRTGNALQLAPNAVRQQVGHLCSLGTLQRAGCIERVRAVADAYKHDELDNAPHYRHLEPFGDIPKVAVLNQRDPHFLRDRRIILRSLVDDAFQGKYLKFDCRTAAGESTRIHEAQ